MTFDGRILGRDEMDELARDAIDGNDDALSRLVEGHIRMFYSMAQKYRNILDPDETVNIMVVNVIEKFRAKFDPNRGNFTKYAKWYAIAGIQWYLRTRLNLVHSKHITGADILPEDFMPAQPSETKRTLFQDPEEWAMTKRKVRKSINKLNPLERQVVCLRFGISTLRTNVDPTKNSIYMQIGEVIGYSAEWVRRILDTALAKMGDDLGDIDLS